MSGNTLLTIDGVHRKAKDGFITENSVHRKIKKALITEGGVHRLCWASVNPVFAESTWDEIIAACQSGKVPAEWKIGDSKPMTINGAEYQIDIIGKNHDDYADGTGKAPLTFQMHDVYTAVYYVMNSSNSNTTGWESCAMRKTHLPAVLKLLPAEVQSGIKEVNKLTSIGNASNTIKTTADKLFLLSEVEVLNTTTRSKTGEGTQYAYYADGNSPIKQRLGTSYQWWLRSPRNIYTTDFTVIQSGGTVNYLAASGNAALSFAFCF